MPAFARMTRRLWRAMRKYAVRRGWPVALQVCEVSEPRLHNCESKGTRWVFTEPCARSDNGILIQV